MIADRGSGPRPARGFVLALTLWMLAAIAVAVGAITLWALSSVRDATVERERLEDQLALAGTRDTLLYLMATRQVTRGGLVPAALGKEERTLRSFDDFGVMDRSAVGGEIRFDGTVYQGMPGVRFAIQDESGLFSLRSVDPYALERFLAWAGIPREKISAMRDAFLDYNDADDLRRLNGAEAREYARASRPRPPNRRLLLSAEVDRILGWDQLPDAVRERLPDLTTTFYTGAVNLNTMPAALLPAWIPGCPDTCKRLVERRDARPFSSSSELEMVLGVRLPGDPSIDYRYLSDDTLRFTLWSRSGAGWRMHVRFMPLADQVGPWSILAVHPTSRPGNDAPAQITGSDLFADTPAGRP